MLLILTFNLLLLYRSATHADLVSFTSLSFCYSYWPYIYFFFTVLLLMLTLYLLFLYRSATHNNLTYILLFYRSAAHADLKSFTSLPFCYSCWPYIFLQESTEHGPKGEPRIRQIKCCWSGHYKYTRQSDNPEQLWPFVNSRARTKSHAASHTRTRNTRVALHKN